MGIIVGIPPAVAYRPPPPAALSPPPGFYCMLGLGGSITQMLNHPKF